MTGVDLFSAGDFSEGDENDEIVLRDPSRGVYKRVVLRDNRIVGAVLYGDTADGAWYFDLLKKGADITKMHDTLIFGQAYQGGGAPLDPVALVAALSDDAEICGCNGVCKGAITQAITAQRPDDARRRARAAPRHPPPAASAPRRSRRCWSRRSAQAMPPRRASRCASAPTSPTRRCAASSWRRRLKSVPAVMQELGWKTSCGCSSCRPALNYYLLCAWPFEYRDDPQSRFINERVHANIQKDGTFSVVPRMWGGLTTPDELRAIADVADKFKIPTVKVTGGQRIDLLGVRKEDLPAVWAQLNAAGIVSGQAYAKGLRTVKTCVGSEWCRFGTQDSTGLGVKLERYLCGSWTPHKVKLAVSGCPRNCAEATVKDIGIICVESGYDIHIAGAAGLHVRATELLGHVATEEEAIEYVRGGAAALSRAGRLSRPRLQVGRQDRHREDPRGDHGRP